MGQKIHPLGFRVGITKRHQSVWFARFQKHQYAQTILEDVFLRKTLQKLLPELLKKKSATSEQTTRIAQIKIERGLIPYEIGIQIYAQNCEALKASIDKLELNPQVLKTVLKTRFLLEKASVKSLAFPKSENGSTSSDLSPKETSTNSDSKTTKIRTENSRKNLRKNGRFGTFTTRLTKKRNLIESFRQRILENVLIIKKGNKIVRKLQNPDIKSSNETKQLKASFGSTKMSSRRNQNLSDVSRSKAFSDQRNKKQSDFSNLTQTRLRSILTENRDQAQKTTKFMNVFLSKTNQNFTRLLKSEFVYWNNYLESYKQDQLQRFGKLQYAPFGFQSKWSFARLKTYQTQSPLFLMKLLKVLQKQALRKLEILRKEFFVLGTISKMKSFTYFQRIRFIKALKGYIQQTSFDAAAKQKQRSLNVAQQTSETFNIQRHKESQAMLKNLKAKALEQKFMNLKNETRKIQFIEQLQHLVQKHRRKNLYLYLATIADSRKYLRQIQKFTQQQANFLFGLNTTALNQMSDEQKRQFLKTQLKKTLQKANRQGDSQKNLQEVFIRQLQQQKFICQQNLSLIPKISLKFYSVKADTIETNATIVTDLIVDKLEKREAFRKVIKKISEDLMKTNKVKGVKIQVSGRLNGAEIARSEWVRAGRVPLQTLRANIDYCYKTAQTIYGIIGVKVWIYRGYTKKNKNA